MFTTKWKALDADGNTLKKWVGPQKTSWIGTQVDGVTVAEIVEDNDISIQEQRRVEFERTLDKMNPVWYNSLTDDQKTRLASWRQEWLDYPSTNTEPTTDVSDIF